MTAKELIDWLLNNAPMDAVIVYDEFGRLVEPTTPEYIAEKNEVVL